MIEVIMVAPRTKAALPIKGISTTMIDEALGSPNNSKGTNRSMALRERTRLELVIKATATLTIKVMAHQGQTRERTTTLTTLPHRQEVRNQQAITIIVARQGQIRREVAIRARMA